MQSDKEVSNPNNNTGRGIRERLLPIVVAGVGLLGVTGVACSPNNSEATPSNDENSSAETTVPSTTEAPTEKGTEGVGEYTEDIKQEMLPELDNIFEQAWSGNVRAQGVSREEVVGEEDGMRFVMIECSDKNIEMSKYVFMGETSRLFAREFVPPHLLLDEEVELYRNSDNPDGNKYGAEIEIFDIYSDGGVGLDLGGATSDKKRFMTQDIYDQGLIQGEEALEPARETIDYIGKLCGLNTPDRESVDSPNNGEQNQANPNPILF